MHFHPVHPSRHPRRTAAARAELLRVYRPSDTSRQVLFTLKNCTFVYGDLESHLMYGSLGPAESTPQTASRSFQQFLHSSRQGVPIFTTGCFFPPRNCPIGQRSHVLDEIQLSTREVAILPPFGSLARCDLLLETGVAWSVSRSVCHVCESCKNGRTDRDAV